MSTEYRTKRRKIVDAVVDIVLFVSILDIFNYNSATFDHKTSFLDLQTSTLRWSNPVSDLWE